ncbi:MAG: SMC-Scp complex subunit ScpB [Candidatus Bathyarchaeia archaeon]
MSQSEESTPPPHPSFQPKQLTIEDIQQAKRLVESALYVAGRPLELKTLCSVSGVSSKKNIQSITRELVDDYRKRESAIEIIELEDGRFAMQLRPQFVGRMRRLSMKPLLTEGPLRTLSYIAYKQPVPQSKVVLVRGPQAYDHINHLLQMGLVTKEKFGKSSLLRTSGVFADYFNLSRDARLMRKQLDAIFADTGWTPDLPQQPSAEQA